MKSFLSCDKQLSDAIERGYLIGKRNVVVDHTGKRISGSRVTDAWCTRCDAQGLPDLIVDPRTHVARVRLDLNPAGKKLRREDLDTINADFLPVARGLASTSETYINITVEAHHLDALLAHLLTASARAIGRK